MMLINVSQKQQIRVEVCRDVHQHSYQVHL